MRFVRIDVRQQCVILVALKGVSRREKPLEFKVPPRNETLLNGRGRSGRSAPRSIPFDCNRGGKSKAQFLNYGTTLWAVAEKCA